MCRILIFSMITLISFNGSELDPLKSPTPGFGERNDAEQSRRPALNENNVTLEWPTDCPWPFAHK